jgi:hypothetical protein
MIWNDKLVVELKYYPSISTETLSKSTINVIQDIRCPDRDLIRVHPVYESRGLLFFRLIFLIRIVGGGVQAGSTVDTSATEWPIVPAPGDYDDGEFGGMKIGRGNRSTRRKPALAPLFPPQIPLDQTRARTRAATVGSQRLTA